MIPTKTTSSERPVFFLQPSTAVTTRHFALPTSGYVAFCSCGRFGRARALEPSAGLNWISSSVFRTSLQMWEDVLGQLRILPVADNPDLGISSTLSVVQDKVRSFVPSDWADNPHMRVSDLTREGLRRILTVFMSTGETLADGTDHAAPFQHQGTGTINTLVLSLLSLIAELRQSFSWDGAILASRSLIDVARRGRGDRGDSGHLDRTCGCVGGATAARECASSRVAGTTRVTRGRTTV